jgi:hypothetical protein
MERDYIEMLLEEEHDVKSAKRDRYDKLRDWKKKQFDPMEKQARI